MGNFKYLDNNKFFDLDFTPTATSANSEFPVTNLQKHSRSFVWRSSGNFVIDATNNKLDFDEGGGELTATITSDTYTAATLATEIKTQLDATGGDTYTVTYSSSTGKWTLASDGGTLEFPWNTGTNTATTIGGTIGFDTSADDTGATSYTGDYVAIHTVERVVLDLGAATNIDSFAMFFNPLSDLPYSGTETIKLQANASDAWASPTVNQTITIDTTWKKACHFFSSNQSYRYWAIEITDPTNSNLYVELATVILADATELTQDPSIGFSQKINDQSKMRGTAYGHEYWDEYPQRSQLTFAYNALGESDKQTLKQMFNTVGQHTPITVAWDTGETIFGDKEEYLSYGRWRSDWGEKQKFINYFDLKVDILECI